jgi:ribosomal protein RSM22 (predicted rRNA methylase)
MQVIIDHGTPSGFDSVAQARELLLELGRRELKARTDEPPAEQNTREAGSYVVAPVRLLSFYVLTYNN